mgnify:FL=1|jgi:glycosyltransferase involved in cell wall biosynthesis
MRLMVNGRNLEGKRTGVGRYLANILEVWSKDLTEKNEFDIYFKNESSSDQFLSNKNFESHVVKNSSLLDYGPVWENFYLPRALNKNDQADLYLTSNYTLPLLPLSVPKVVTIFDISYIAHPEWFPKRQLASLKPLTGPTVRAADIVLTGSEATKNEILKYYDIDGNKIKVTNLGVDGRFLSLDQDVNNGHAQRVKDKYNLVGKVVLFVGLVMNRRNIPVLMEAISNVKKKTGEQITLVILGKNNTFPYIDIDKTAADLDITENLRWIQYSSDEDVYGLYKAADVFMCISLYEGFNITPLEALQLGVPVICSNMSSLPEVVGDAAYLLDDPRDPAEMTVGLEKVLGDSQFKNDLIAKGKIQSSQFSWERCADETMAILKTLV